MPGIGNGCTPVVPRRAGFRGAGGACVAVARDARQGQSEFRNRAGLEIRGLSRQQLGRLHRIGGGMFDPGV